MAARAWATASDARRIRDRGGGLRRALPTIYALIPAARDLARLPRRVCFAQALCQQVGVAWGGASGWLPASRRAELLALCRPVWRRRRLRHRPGGASRGARSITRNTLARTSQRAVATRCWRTSASGLAASSAEGRWRDRSHLEFARTTVKG